VTEVQRFLSVRLGPHHVQVEPSAPSARGLVLEFESGQWVLYYLDADDQMIGCLFPGALDAGFDHARREFGVRPEEWIEDSSN